MKEREGIAAIGQIAAEMMEGLEEEEMPADSKKATVGIVAIVVEMEIEHDDGVKTNYLHYRCSDPRRWIQAGLFGQAERAVYASDEVREDE